PQESQHSYISGVVAQGGAPSNQGLFLVYGHTLHNDTDQIWLAHLNAAGEPAWQETYGLGSLQMYGYDLALAADGKTALLVGDVGQNSINTWHFGQLLMRVDLPSGEALSYKFSGVEGNDRFHSIMALSTGGYFMTGSLEQPITDPISGQVTNYLNRPILTRFGEDADACGVVGPDPILGGGN
ncbi:MAG: hypothetical protein VX938_11320, partial [Myxococcota bacterium]|nr:hypothetical protein [Myxococcota bacterium]